MSRNERDELVIKISEKDIVLPKGSRSFFYRSDNTNEIYFEIIYENLPEQFKDWLLKKLGDDQKDIN